MSDPDKCPKCGGEFKETKHPIIPERGRMCMKCGWATRINLFMDETEI